MLNRRSFVAGSLGAAFSFGAAQGAINPLSRVKTWMYALQRLEYPIFVSQLAASNFDMLVIEPGIDFKDGPYPARQILRQLRVKPDGKRRVVLAYVDIGQAEDFRSYWTDDWRPPQPGQAGFPRFLVAPDPDGWTGDYNVAYWDPGWKKIWLGRGGLITQLAMTGFDGIYMDWVSAYEEPSVARRAARDGVDPALEMIRFIRQMRMTGRAVNPHFLAVPQNATDLIDAHPAAYASVIDGFAAEDTWFRGAPNASWTSPRAGDLPSEIPGTPAQRIANYKPYMDRGLPVFTVDYCISRSNAAQVYRDARAAGLVPLVTRVSLDHMTVTPPPP